MSGRTTWPGLCKPPRLTSALAARSAVFGGWPATHSVAIHIMYFVSLVVGRNAHDVPAKRHPISHERYDYCSVFLCRVHLLSIYFMGLIDVYVTGWGGGKSWPRAEGPGAGSRRLTAAFLSSPRSPARRSPLGSPANTLEMCSHGLTRCRMSGAHRNRVVRRTLLPRHNESMSVK